MKIELTYTDQRRRWDGEAKEAEEAGEEVKKCSQCSLMIK
jgi:hypothetical protein